MITQTGSATTTSTPITATATAKRIRRRSKGRRSKTAEEERYGKLLAFARREIDHPFNSVAFFYDVDTFSDSVEDVLSVTLERFDDLGIRNNYDVLLHLLTAAKLMQTAPVADVWNEMYDPAKSAVWSRLRRALDLLSSPLRPDKIEKGVYYVEGLADALSRPRYKAPGS